MRSTTENISLSAKLKAAHEDLVPHKVVIGQKEVDSGFAELERLIEELAQAMSNKPFIRREWPPEVSKLL